MHTLKTPNATVLHHSDFTSIVIHPNQGLQGDQPLHLMDIKEIYASSFRQWLTERIKQMKPDDVIKLGYYVGEHYPSYVPDLGNEQRAHMLDAERVPESKK